MLSSSLPSSSVTSSAPATAPATALMAAPVATGDATPAVIPSALPLAAEGCWPTRIAWAATFAVTNAASASKAPAAASSAQVPPDPESRMTAGAARFAAGGCTSDAADSSSLPSPPPSSWHARVPGLARFRPDSSSTRERIKPRAPRCEPAPARAPCDSFEPAAASTWTIDVVSAASAELRSAAPL